METATQQITVCDKCFTVACWNGTVMCSQARSAGTITDTPENISKMTYGLAPAPQETPTQHSPLPWRIDGYDIMHGAGKNYVAMCYGIGTKTAKANAEFIVRRVNASDALIAALEDMIDMWQRFQKNNRNIEHDSQVIAAREALRLAREGEE